MKALKTILMAGAVFAGAMWGSPDADAKTMALLVGVADYNEASGIHSLLGPRNDVSIMWRALKARGASPDDLTVLTDHLPTSPDFPVAKGLPISTNILAELDRLAKVAERGDTVIFYYSGHGTRQPADPKYLQDEPEADGMDQVLLPADVGSYDPIKMTIRNALVDNTLGDKITAIRNKGAFVWAIVDACHSSTVTRGEEVVRSVDPATLGVPDTPTPAPEASRSTERDGTLRAAVEIPGDGGLVGFYAVESSDQAIERPFPGYNMPMVGDDPKKQRMGVFTYLIHRALTENTASTYRDLAQQVVAELSSDRTGGKVPPPVFDGDLDEAIPGSTGDKLPNSVSGLVQDGKISFPAGTLQGFEEGAQLALYAPGKVDKPIGHVTIATSSAVDSTAENIDWVQGADQISNGTIAAVVTEPAINFRFVVAPPPAGDLTDAGAKAETASAIDAAFKDDAQALGVSLGDAGNPDADVMLRVKNNRLWVVRSDRPWVTTAGAYDETPSIALGDGPEKTGAALKTAVWSLARAAKLLRVTSAMEPNGGEDDGLKITASIARSPKQDDKAACSGIDAPADAKPVDLQPLLPAAAGNCSYVDIEVTNDGDLDYYVAGFYVDALGGVSAIPANTAKRGCVRTLPAGADKPLQFRFWIDTWDEKANKPSTVGAENFVVLAVPKLAAHEPPRLCALTQPTLQAMQQTRDVEIAGTRSANQKLASLIGNVEGGATRGVSAAPETDDGPKMTGRLFVFDVKP